MAIANKHQKEKHNNEKPTEERINIKVNRL